MKSDNYLITGASGFLGAKILKDLILKKIKVNGLDKNLLNNSLKKKIIRCDILDEKKLKKILPKYKNIIHLAAENSRSTYKKNKLKSHQVNVIGSENILKNLNKDQNFFFFSSCQVYDEFSKKIITEKTKTSTKDIYGKSKILTEKTIIKYAKEKGFNFCILRIFYVFGEGQNNEFLIPTLINQGFKNKTIEIWDQNSFRDLQYINDLSSNFQTVLLNKEKAFSKIINLGSGSRTSMKQVGKILSSKIKCNLFLKIKDKSVNCYTSMKFFEKTFNKKIKKTPLEKALNKTISYYLKS
ncbi:NAD-dependent epimerase/dehydratase family protein [Candidatus Pelagibacter sp. Uisw_136]|uniref:NAD-dependent epimerase/dehydratase family protein n=1 Tax=Candidatus Pelagibacter sp. Uisw_136 TaxID=3230991 RepID=UPI0039EA49C7